MVMFRNIISVTLLAVAAGSLISLAAKTALSSNSTCSYQVNGVLPDSRCTPGVINHAVTQATLKTTVCVPGWSTEHRPSVRVTEPEKLAAMRLYGYGFGTDPSNYEYDHKIPISLGGALNDPGNLWPEPHHAMVNGKDEGSFTKDRVEFKLWRAVCNGAMKLWQARRIMRTDWRTGE